MISPKCHGSKTVEGLPNAALTVGFLGSCHGLGWLSGSSLHFRYQVKFFYLCQLAYWLHALPELYFQKVRKVRARWRFWEREGLGEGGWRGLRC